MPEFNVSLADGSSLKVNAKKKPTKEEIAVFLRDNPVREKPSKTDTQKRQFQPQIRTADESQVKPLRIEGPSDNRFIELKNGGRLPVIDKLEKFNNLTGFNVSPPDALMRPTKRLKVSFLKGFVEGLPFVNPDTILAKKELDNIKDQSLFEKSAGFTGMMTSFPISLKGIDKAISNPIIKPITNKLPNMVGEALNFGASFGIFEFTKPADNLKERVNKSANAAVIGAVLPPAVRALIGTAKFPLKAISFAAEKASSAIGKVFDAVPRSNQFLEPVRKLIESRVGNINADKFDTSLFVSGIRSNYSKAELEQVPFVIEGTVKNPSPRVRALADEFSKRYEKSRQFLLEHLDDIGFQENYVNRIWDLPRAKVIQVSNSLSKSNPFLKQRKIPTLKEGIDAGLKPRTTDITELFEVYENYRIRTIENINFIKAIRDMVDGAGRKVIQAAKSAPDDYVILNHPALNQVFKVGKVQVERAVKVHPDILKPLQVILGETSRKSMVKGFETINAFFKAASLSFSFFHAFALTESALSAGLKNRQIAKAAFDMFSIYARFFARPMQTIGRVRAGEFNTAITNAELAKDGIKHGLQLGSIADAQRGVVADALRTAVLRTEGNLILNSGMRAVRGFKDVWDAGLWDSLHNSFKIMAYEKNVQMMANRFPRRSITDIKRSVSQTVNDQFGGQVWERLMVTPRGRQVAQWTFLAPDWTLSVLRQAAMPFGRDALRRKIGRDFWLRFGFKMFGLIQVINGTSHLIHDGEWKWTWENDPGQLLNFYVGRDAEGRRQYAVPGKQAKEVLRWFIEPDKIFAAKLSPAIKLAFKVLSGTSVTGFDQPFKGDKFIDSLLERSLTIVSEVVPFSFRGSSQFGLTLPKQTITQFKVQKGIEEGIRKKDSKLIARWLRTAQESGLDGKRALTAARRAARSNAKTRRFL